MRAEIVFLFEETLISGFTWVNTRLGFDLKLFSLPKNSDGKAKESLKVVHKIGDEDKQIVTKILQMDENNQYRNTMTKPW